MDFDDQFIGISRITTWFNPTKNSIALRPNAEWSLLKLKQGSKKQLRKFTTDQETFKLEKTGRMGKTKDDPKREKKTDETPEMKGTKRKGKDGNKREVKRGKDKKIAMPTSGEIHDWTNEEFDSVFVEQIWQEGFFKDLKQTMILELGNYLTYLWNHYNPEESSTEHVMSIMAMVNEKFREGVPAWDVFRGREEDFSKMFGKILSVEITYPLATLITVFLINCFQSLEEDMVREECMKLVSPGLWVSVSQERRNREFKLQPRAAKIWERFQKSDKSKTNRHYIPAFLDLYLATLDSLTASHVTKPSPDALLKIEFCERAVELMLDLVSQVPTRRFFLLLLRDKHVVLRSSQAPLYTTDTPRKLFLQLVLMLRFFEGFEVDTYTGDSLDEDQIANRQADQVRDLQKLVFEHFYDTPLKEIALSNISAVGTPDALLTYLRRLPDHHLRSLAHHLSLLPENSNHPPAMITHIITNEFEKRMSQLEAVNNMPVYPTEDILWDDNVIPSDEYTGEHCLALPKLNLQFLSLYDYLYRNFDLYRLESAYEIRGDIEDAVARCNARIDPSGNQGKGSTTFTGWSRMALPISEFHIESVGKSLLGENHPSEVTGRISYDVSNCKGRLRDEWDSLKLHDVLFLVTLRPLLHLGQPAQDTLPFCQQYGVHSVRGCEVHQLLDEKNKVIKDQEHEVATPAGTLRTLRVWLDPSQYKIDMETKEEDVYGSFNLLVRRRPKENNFKAVLETIRELMNTNTAVPEWLHDTFLGYGNPKEANIASHKEYLDYVDTFLHVDHLKACFPEAKIKWLNAKGHATSDAASLQPPFKLQFPEKSKDGSEGSLTVLAYEPINAGPYPQDIPKKNAVPFTPTQVKGITSGMNTGLTLIVGPPGTGKTDVAVQIISNWYHNFPQQRTLLVTHSNQALNQLFEKLIQLDIDERHLLRLGHGNELLETSKDFSKMGRVNLVLERRLLKLKEVERLGKSLGFQADVAYTCETAEHFYLSHVKEVWDRYLSQVSNNCQAAARLFPFKNFFSDVGELFPGKSGEEDLAIAQGCWVHLDRLFSELREARAFELLRNPYDRANFLLTKQAKIVAMTCTHAAIKRKELIQLGFQYDNLLMEEAGQILEIETFIPMLLQKEDMGKSKLKRVVLIGDHHQLPPIVKNIAFQKYSHLDQSLFTRLIRLGVPTVQLDSQGRARPSIAQLYNWRYSHLGNLPVTSSSHFTKANPGFAFDYQMVDVADYNGKGEMTPGPHFYQNLGEAEYLVAVYMYMRLLGYPADKITILTTYNGQKELLRDVITSRCSHPFFGKPKKISTVDRYQGQQNDYVLLSLVRTKGVGHIRDVRRLVVAMSRARLGLYVFCRKNLFSNCFELTPAFSKFLQRPTQLQLVQDEGYPCSRTVDAPTHPFPVEDVIHMGRLVEQMQQSLADQMQAEKPAEAVPVPQPPALTQEKKNTSQNGKEEEEEESEDE